MMSDKQINKQETDFSNIEEELRAWYADSEILYFEEAILNRTLGSFEAAFNAQFLGTSAAFEAEYGDKVPKINVQDGIGDMVERAFGNFHNRINRTFGRKRGWLTRKADEKFARYGFVPQYEVNIDNVPRFEPETGLKPLLKAKEGRYLLENRLDDVHRREIAVNFEKQNFKVHIQLDPDNPTRYAFTSLNDAIAGAKVYYDYVNKAGFVKQ